MKRLLARYNSLSIPAKASVWFLICTFLQKGISVIATPIFTRLLSTEEYGQVSVYTSWLNIIIIIVTLNIPEGVFTQGLVKYDDKKYEFVSAIHGLTITLVAVWFGVYLLFRGSWNKLFGLTTIQMTTMFLQIWASTIVMLWSRVQRVAYKYKILVAMTLIHAVLRPLCGIIAIQVFQDKVTTRIMEMALVDFVLYFPLFLIQMKQGKVFFSKKIWGYAIAFNAPLLAHFLSQTVLNSSDRIMIQKMISDDAAGIYTLAYQIALLVNLFSHAMKQAMSPWTFQTLKAGRSERIQRVGFTSLIIMAAVSLLFISFAPEIVRIFAPPNYHDAIWVIPPVTLSVFFQLMYLLFVDIEFYFEKTKHVAISTLCGAALNVLLNYFFIKLFGYYAAGYTTLVCFMFIAVLHYFFMLKANGQKMEEGAIYNGKKLFLLSVCVLGIGMLITVVYKNVLLRYCIIIIIVALIAAFHKRIIGFINETRSIK